MSLATLTDIERKTLLRIIVDLLGLDFYKTTPDEVRHALVDLKEAAGGIE